MTRRCSLGCICRRHMTPERFWARVVKTQFGCWFYRNRNGELSRKHRGWHRFSLELKLGRSLGVGMEACHTCDVGGCVRPDHLFEGTHAANMADAKRKGRLHQTVESRRRISVARKGKKLSRLHRKKLSLAHLGQVRTPETREAIGRFWRGRRRGAFSESH